MPAQASFDRRRQTTSEQIGLKREKDFKNQENFFDTSFFLPELTDAMGAAREVHTMQTTLRRAMLQSMFRHFLRATQ